MQDFTDYPELANETLGGNVVAANDDFFASKENLLVPEEAVFDAERYQPRGKWMDGWETRRRREPGHDWCIVRLGIPGLVRGVVVDTAFFRGNYPEHCSLEGCGVDGYPSVAELLSDRCQWQELLPQSPLQGDHKNRFALPDGKRVTHLRLRIFPDGGVARLRVHGEPMPDWSRIASPDSEVELSSVEHGGDVIACSDMFFGNRRNLIRADRARSMKEGWEVKRRRDDGHDWAVLRLGLRGTITGVEVDTSFFRGNAPGHCAIELCDTPAEGDEIPSGPWHSLLPKTPLLPHARHRYRAVLQTSGPARYARLRIFPDGGTSRLRLLGRVDTEEWQRLGTDRLNAMLDADAAAALRRCCGAKSWVDAMLRARPFASAQAVFAAAEAADKSLTDDDWLEAFSHHPRIGAKGPAAAQDADAARWSAGEQSAVADADSGTRSRLAEANLAYDAKFGFIFIVCATGKSAQEMLELINARIHNDPATELPIAAGEQRKITKLRLQKLLLGC